MAPRSNPIPRRNGIAAAGHHKLEPSAAVDKADETRRYDFREMSEALSGAGPRIKKRSNPILRSNVVAATDHQKQEPSEGDEKADETRRYDFWEMSEALSGAEVRIKKRSRLHKLKIRRMRYIELMCLRGKVSSVSDTNQAVPRNEAGETVATPPNWGRAD